MKNNNAAAWRGQNYCQQANESIIKHFVFSSFLCGPRRENVLTSKRWTRPLPSFRFRPRFKPFYFFFCLFNFKQFTSTTFRHLHKPNWKKRKRVWEKCSKVFIDFRQRRVGNLSRAIWRWHRNNIRASNGNPNWIGWEVVLIFFFFFLARIHSPLLG